MAVNPYAQAPAGVSGNATAISEAGQEALNFANKALS